MTEHKASISGMNNSTFIHNSKEAHHGIVRSNSIEVLLLAEDEQKKQNQYQIGEEEKS